jgi:ATP-dependent DNA helicase DinG
MLSDEVKSEIQTAYSRFLETKGWQARGGQKQMIAEIARTLASVDTDSKGNRRPDKENHLCIVEAGTGTGKTIAYCLAAIPIARALKKSLVISTATVALQEQLVHRDLPDLMEASGLQFQFALAKGRGRYLCPSKLDTLLEGSDMDPTLALYPDEIPQQFESDTENLYREMAESLARGDWDGDRDNWPQHVEGADWFRLTTDHNQCAGRRCAYITQCPFFSSRDQLQNFEVIVANHDLVLADQALVGGAILPEPQSTIFIFD